MRRGGKSREYQDESVYRIYDATGAYLTSYAGRVHVDDEYIAGDDKLYIVVGVDDAMLTATANYVGIEIADEQVETQAAFAPDAAAATQAPDAGGGKKLRPCTRPTSTNVLRALRRHLLQDQGGRHPGRGRRAQGKP